MSSAMDALKYSNYMSQSMGLYGYSGQETSPTGTQSTSVTAGTAASDTAPESQTKLSYSAEALSRSYLEQQKSYYESAACLKGYGGGGGGGLERPSSQSAYDAKSYTPESMTDRQSTESPDIKKPVGGLDNDSASVLQQQQQHQQQQQAAALQAYYSGGGGVAGSGQSAALPPLLPMAAQLSQYGSGAGYSQPAAPTGADYSRRPLSVLF